MERERRMISSVFLVLVKRKLNFTMLRRISENGLHKYKS